MKTSEFLLPLYDSEVKNTRRILEVVPEDKFGWKPHPKSGDLRWLATHVGELPTFLTTIVETENLDLTSGNMPRFKPSNRSELLAGFEEHAKKAREAIASASEEHMGKHWSLTFKGQEVFAGVRRELLETTICHLVHHRAQLTVYLRLNDVAFPGVYGPSADEMGAFK